jgi:hypothetical protein
MTGWMLLLLVSAGNMTVPMQVHVESKQACQNQGHRADQVAKAIKGVKVKWVCRQTMPVPPGAE